MPSRRAALAGAAAVLVPMPEITRMRHQAFDPSDASYAQACLVTRQSRLLFVSGQVPTGADGAAPSDFDAQCRLAWANVEAQLAKAGMGLDHLAKVTIYLADRAHRAANTRIRHEVLAGRTPALTVIIAEIFDPAWLLEIEAVAAA